MTKAKESQLHINNLNCWLFGWQFHLPRSDQWTLFWCLRTIPPWSPTVSNRGGGCIPRSFPRYSSPLRGMLVIRCVNSFQTSPRQAECFSGRALTLGQFRPSEELPFSSQRQEGALSLVLTTLSGRSSLISVVLDIHSVPLSRQLVDFIFWW